VINRGHRYLFITPWRDQSLVGTFQAAYDDEPEHCRVTEQEVLGFLKEVNSSLPAANLQRQDVHFVYVGLVPRGDSGAEQGYAQLLKHPQILDHERGDGVRGLASVVGVKFTTARSVAEQVVDVLLAKLGRPKRPSATAWLPLLGGQMFNFDEFLESETRKRPSGITEVVHNHLIYTYGCQYREILKYGNENPVWNEPISSGVPVIPAEVLHGIRREMAQSLEDIVFRRTELGTAGHPGEACLEHCADILQRELGWDRARRHSEIDRVQTTFSQRSYQQWATA
jgi:glycerol-3-phosphate dehydrogenase